MLVTRVERLEAAAPAAGGRLRIYAFDLEASVEDDVDPADGMVVNLGAMKETLRREVTGPLRGALLDGREAPRCPTPESLARAIWRLLGGTLAGKPLRRVRLAGRPSPTVDCYGEGDMDVTRTYEFSASHRLHSPRLTDEENRRVFGKCNNPQGHGHNYVLDVTLRGDPGETGEVVDAAELDRVVEEEVVARWDHRNLNADVPELAGVNPTAEEIVRVAWRRIAAKLAGSAVTARLHRVRLRETDRNHVEYFGD